MAAMAISKGVRTGLTGEWVDGSGESPSCLTTLGSDAPPATSPWSGPRCTCPGEEQDAFLAG